MPKLIACTSCGSGRLQRFELLRTDEKAQARWGRCRSESASDRKFRCVSGVGPDGDRHVLDARLTGVDRGRA